MDNIDTMFEELEHVVKKDMPASATIPSFAEHFKPFALANSLGGLYDDTKLVAEKIGWRTLRKAKKELNKSTNDFDEAALDRAAIAYR